MGRERVERHAPRVEVREQRRDRPGIAGLVYGGITYTDLPIQMIGYPMADLSAQEPGWIAQIAVKEGEAVEARLLAGGNDGADAGN